MTVQLCPKCLGTGVMSRPPGIPADQRTWTWSTVGPFVCNLCDGRKVLDLATRPVHRTATHDDEGTGR